MVLVVAFNGTVHKALNELTLPLEHEDIIRQQAKEKGVDAALIAAVIDTESKFVADAESGAGARGLMQVTPEAAKDIARHSGATTFHTSRPLQSRNQHQVRDLPARRTDRTATKATWPRRSPPTTPGPGRSKSGAATS